MEGTELTRQRRIWWLLAATAAAAIFAAAIWWTGGFSVRIAGVQVRSHSWVRPAIVALICAALLFRLGRPRVTAALAGAWTPSVSLRVERAIVVAAMCWALTAGIVFGTFAIGGSDSFGYASQARLFARGQLTDTIPLRAAFTWNDVEASLTPLGFNRGQSPGVIAPRYPPGLPLLLAPLTTLSESAIYMLVPVLGVLVVLGTYRLGVRLGDPLAGAVAAMLLSVSPTFLYQLVQPMSDVPVTACWLWGLLMASNGTRSAAVAAGALSSLAILIRPNLTPLAAFVLVPVVFSDAGDRARRVLLFVAAALPGVLALGWIQAVRYGSPLASGYGTLAAGFKAAHIGPNLARYPRWLTESHTWFIWLWLLAPVWIAGRAARGPRRAFCARWGGARGGASGGARPLLAWTAVAMILAIWTAYLPYFYFHPEEWFYTRFLLPAIPLMLFFAVAVSLWALRGLPAALRLPVAAALLLALLATEVHQARTRGAFDIRFQERKYPQAGAFVRDELPATAFILAVQHSGSIRYYAGRPTLRWDVISPGRLDQVLSILRAEGFEPFVVVDGAEDEAFRSRFEAADQRAVRGLSPLAVLGDARVYGFER